MKDLRLAVIVAWCLPWTVATAAPGARLIPISPNYDPLELTYRFTLSGALDLQAEGRDTYVRMVVRPSFEGESAVSLYGPGPVGGMEIVSVEAAKSIWHAVRDQVGTSPTDTVASLQVDIPVRRRRAPVEARLGFKILDAFQRAFKKARFKIDRGIPLDPDTFEFSVHLFGGGLASAELDAPRGSVPDHQLYRLAAEMIRYARGALRAGSDRGRT